MALHHVGADVEVRVDRVDVVVVLERVDQPQQLARAVLVERDARLGPLRDLGALDLDAGVLSAARTAARSAGSVSDLEDVVVDRDVLRARVDRDDQVVLAVALGVDDDHALLVEQVRDRARLAEVAAVLGERVAHLGARAVAVVGQRLDRIATPPGP